MTDRDDVESTALVVRGGVERGDQRGRTLGFPTANLAITDDALLDGVWAGWVERGGARRLRVEPGQENPELGPVVGAVLQLPGCDGRGVGDHGHRVAQPARQGRGDLTPE